ncbi:MAG: regulatory protein RecX [Anaerovoracaceae bacterium]
MEKMDKALNAALKYLSYQERTEQEVRKYLKGKEFDAGEIEKTVLYLRDMGYVNDRGYAVRYAEQAVRKGKGSLKIKAELRKKGIEDEILEDIDEEVREEFGSEYQRAEEEARRFADEYGPLLEALPEETYEEKAEKYKEKQRLTAKLGRRLAGRGFPQDIIFQVIREAFEEF